MPEFLQLGLLAGGAAIGFAAAHLMKQRARTDDAATGLCPEHVVRSVSDLRRTVPSGGSGSTVGDAKKVRHYLDCQMLRFIRTSPFIQLATADANGLPYVSPKGDEPGFVQVEMDDGRGVALLVPDRPGNRLLFGLQNVLEGSGRVGLLFEVPGNCHTLRCGGVAAVSRDPSLLRRFAARGRDAKMVLRVRVDYAFFHCAKAYLRSRLWEPDTWPAPGACEVTFGRYFTRQTLAVDAIDAEVSAEYAAVRAAVEDGHAEPDYDLSTPTPLMAR